MKDGTAKGYDLQQRGRDGPGARASIAQRIEPPRSWSSPSTHYLRVLEHPWYRLVAELTDTLTSLTVTFWRERGIRNLHLPLTTTSVSSPMGAGSDSTPVAVKVGGIDTHLADSMQFLLEYGCRIFPGGCYYLMPSFRGEDADATHLPQFFHSEAEVCGGLDEVIGLVGDYISFLARGIIGALDSWVARAAGTLGHLEWAAEGSPIARVTLGEAEHLLGEDPALIRHDPRGFRVLTRSGEQRLMQLAGAEAIWVTEMDHLSVPFYQAFTDATMERALNADLLLGVGETVGAGERHADAASLDRALSLHGIRSDDYAWYRTMKDQYPLRTSGFGMGIERFLLWVLRHDDIRDIPLVLRFNGLPVQP